MTQHSNSSLRDTLETPGELSRELGLTDDGLLKVTDGFANFNVDLAKVRLRLGLLRQVVNDNAGMFLRTEGFTEVWSLGSPGGRITIRIPDVDDLLLSERPGAAAAFLKLLHNAELQVADLRLERHSGVPVGVLT